jgi:hemerythrin-like domain-containing protein
LLFQKKNWFPRFIIIRREQESGGGGENSDEWFGFVKQIKRHLEHETSKLKEMLNRSIDSTKRQMNTGQEKVTAEVAEVKKDTAEVKKVTA